jgi:hypothetical protein
MPRELVERRGHSWVGASFKSQAEALGGPCFRLWRLRAYFKASSMAFISTLHSRNIFAAFT